jgi:catechol 2,3-dioxygenase-like lactoylglutathione lyase family enzyme
MPNRITHTQVFVLDQDQALDFYVGKLGFEVNTDADLGFMRWLTVNFPGQPDHQLLLEKPGPPAHDDATAEQIRELVTKGAMGVGAIIAVDDIHRTYEELVAQGVEFTEEPTERFYGTDCGCATRSATTCGSARPRRPRSRSRTRATSQPRTRRAPARGRRYWPGAG